MGSVRFVLLVDDNQIIRHSYEVALRKAGFEVDACGSVETALELLKRGHKYSVVVSDLCMPDKSGVDLVQHIRASPGDFMLPVLILTGSTSRADVIANLNAGVSDYVPKEPDKAVFLARVRNLVRMKELQDELAVALNIDELTGIANRRHGKQLLTSAITEARHAESDLAVALLDIDHFKAVNDQWGHKAGDEVLREVANRASVAAQANDGIVARWGGEEFLLFLPGTPCEEALGVIEQVRIQVSAEPVFTSDPEPADGISVTISAGLVYLVEPDTLDTVVARADSGLYRSKEGGRNRVTVVEHEPPTPEESTRTGLPQE